MYNDQPGKIKCVLPLPKNNIKQHFKVQYLLTVPKAEESKASEA